jgi:hypothetical protein
VGTSCWSEPKRGRPVSFDFLVRFVPQRLHQPRARLKQP